MATMILSEQEIVEIISDYIMARPNFTTSSEVHVRFEIRHNYFKDRELCCIVEGN